MPTVNMLDAKSSLSELVRAVESGEHEEIIIARNGVPAARLVPIQKKSTRRRLGLAKGEFEIPDDFDALDRKVEVLFGTSGQA